MSTKKDPSPEQIAAACLLIQTTWTADEKLKRLRVDLRPTFTGADGLTQRIDAVVYDDHHQQHEELQPCPK